jgi:ABC-type arginine transport system ATPase subunit
MENDKIHLNFTAMANALWWHVREKAIAAGSNIVYIENGKLVEENPTDKTKKPFSKN